MAVRTGPQPMPGGMPPMPGIMGAPMGPPVGMPGMGGMPGMPSMQQPMPMPMGGPLGGPAPGPHGGRPASLGTLPAPSTAEQRAGFGAAVGAVVGSPVMGALPSDVFAGGIPGGMMDGSIPRPVAQMRDGGVAYMQGGGDPLAAFSGKAPGYENVARYYKDPVTGQLGYGIGVTPNLITANQDALKREFQSRVASMEAQKDIVSDYFAANPAAYYQNMRFDASPDPKTGKAPVGSIWHAQEGTWVAPETIASAVEWSRSGRPTYTLGFDESGSAIGIPVTEASTVSGAGAGGGGGGTSFVSPYTPLYVEPEPTPVSVSQPGSGIMNALPGEVLQTSAGPVMGSVYQPIVSSIPTFVGGVSDVFGTRPVTYVGSPQATIRSRIGEIDLPARPQSINIFDFLASPVVGYGGLR